MKSKISTEILARRLMIGELQRRWQKILVLAGFTGVATGLLVAGFEELTLRMLFEWVQGLPLAAQAIAPGIGLVLNALVLWYLPPGKLTPTTSDAYIQAFHDRHKKMELRKVPSRFLGGVLTLGSGGALGLEGPSMYTGAAIGAGLQRRFSGLFTRDESKLLLVAGAAAGVAAIFKAPATGVIFALEVPFQADLARRALLPALIAAAASYVTFAAIAGTEPLFRVAGSPPLDVKDLGGAVLLGVLAGAGARGFARLLRLGKAWSRGGSPLVRIAAASVLMAGLFYASHALFDASLSFGPGYRTVEWAIDPDRGIWLVAALFAIRGIATTTVLAGGGTGGLFIPLVVQGTLLGRLVGGVLHVSTGALFPMLGLAAFLGAGYRAPLAAVVFVAESTGRAGYVVPALIAAAVSQLIMGRKSVSDYQKAGRAGHLERRFSLPISTAIQTDVYTVPPEATLDEFVNYHLLGARHKSVPVVKGGRYLGMMRMEDLEDIERETWSTTPVEDAMQTTVPTASPSWKLRQAIQTMEGADIDAVAVVDDEGLLVGMVTTRDILKLDEILETREEAERVERIRSPVAERPD